MSGYLGDLSIEQAAALEQLKVEFDDWVAQNEKVWLYKAVQQKEMIQNGEIEDAVFLRSGFIYFRFLRARKFDVPKAVALLKSIMIWRDEFSGGVSSITAESVRKELDSGSSFIYGWDYEDRPVGYIRARLFDPNRSSPEDIQRTMVYFFEQGRRLIRYPVETVTLVCDVAGVSCTPALTAGKQVNLGVTKFLFQLFATFYPESLSRAFVLNSAGLVDTSFKVLRPFIPEATRKKILFVNKLTLLREFIPARYLLKEYGGDAEYEFVSPHIIPQWMHDEAGLHRSQSRSLRQSQLDTSSQASQASQSSSSSVPPSASEPLARTPTEATEAEVPLTAAPSPPVVPRFAPRLQAVLDRLTSEQKSLLAEHNRRWLEMGQGSELAGTEWNTDLVSDVFHLKFLVARRWNVQKALESEAFTLRWRRDYQPGGGLAGVLAVTEELIEVEAAKELGYFHGTDVNGTPLYWVHVKKHNAATRDLVSIQNYAVWLMEYARKTYIPQGHDRFSLVFDMRGFSASKNMDMKVAKFLIDAFQNYYPESLERALVFEAPWLFSGVYSIVRPWLDEVTAAKVKFVTKTTLKDDVPIEFLPPDFGGESDFLYSYVPIAQRPLHAPTALPGMVTLDDERWSSSWSSFEESALETAESDTDESAESAEKAEEHGLRATADSLVWAEVTAPIRVLYEEDKLFQALRVMESIERELAARFEGPLQAVVLQRLRDQAVCSVLRRECEQARKTLAEIDINNGWVEMQRTKNIVTHYKHEEGQRFHSIRVQGRIPSSFINIAALTNEVDLYPSWIPLISKAYEKRVLSRFKKFVHLPFDGLPFPKFIVSPRDLCAYAYAVNMLEDEGVIAAFVRSCDPDHDPEHNHAEALPGWLRVETKTGFVLRPISNEESEVTVVAVSDPKMDFVPAGVINWFIKKLCPHMLNLFSSLVNNIGEEHKRRISTKPLYRDIAKIFDDYMKAPRTESGSSAPPAEGKGERVEGFLLLKAQGSWTKFWCQLEAGQFRTYAYQGVEETLGRVANIRGCSMSLSHGSVSALEIATAGEPLILYAVGSSDSQRWRTALISQGAVYTEQESESEESSENWDLGSQEDGFYTPSEQSEEVSL